jgi:Astacin (Peptidase family M12A)/Divergent InlB B-repeat domain
MISITRSSVHRRSIATAGAVLMIFALGVAAQTPRPDLRTGTYHGKPVTFEVKNGWAVVEGDIILGRPEELQGTAVRTSPQLRPHALTMIPTASSLWPKVGNIYQVPYTNDNGNAVADQAVALFNTTMQGVIQYVKRTNEPDYVQFNLDTTACSSQSYVGRIGGPQQISGSANSDCVTVIMHEMGHACGFHHEQARSDRDNYVQIQWFNIDPGKRSQYDPDPGIIDVGFYDLGSAMHYSDTLFALDSTDVTVSSLPVGIPFKDGGGYSAGDIDALRRLYKSAPTQVTIASNPPGFQVTVDDQIVTTGTPGATFTWVLGSQHTLDVPANLQLQTVNGATYAFGRWNDIPALNQPARHTITIAPGDDTYFYPGTSPKYTTYSANFRLLVPAAGAMTTAVSPAGAGAATLSGDPVNLQGTNYYYSFQPLTVTAAPAAGFNFYDWQFDGNSAVVSGANPRVARPNLNQSVTARFAQNPVTGIVTVPGSLPVTVDGTQVYAPKNFAQDYDTAWTAGSSHSIAAASPLPSNVVDPKARLIFANWSDGGAQTHNVTVGANAVVTATYNTQFLLNATQFGVQLNNTASNCAGTFTAAPTSPDNYYNQGTLVNVSVQPNAGWTFLGWQGDATGTANQLSVTLSASRNVQALFNTTNAPLSIASLVPQVAPLNGKDPINLTINGTGFTANTQVCFIPPGAAGPCFPVTFQSANLVQVQVTPDMLTKEQTWTVVAGNSPDGQCSVNANSTFTVSGRAETARR